uniref:DnaJ heat shock protein family (Hsp40) member C24 n=1 Tax=Junco hyemalis TaxID=40217 RepID=A0A8C5NJV1_JUNHY
MALGRMEQKDWYKVLGAKPSDSPAELKRKYQKLALLHHPDKQAAGAAEAEERGQRFLEIHQAWKVLGNEETKQEYDLQQRGRFLPRRAGVAAAPYLSQGLGVVVSWCLKMLFSAERNAAFTPVLLSGVDPLFIA